LSHKVDTPTIIGVVGNTGAGKSSVINAMLEEERLVPTNCMRACTAVVTELSYNSSEDENEKYRAEIAFIQAADWEHDLRISLTELIDGNGQVCDTALQL
jgi:ATPase subunit of ABC transporter with duplicated ATPase domains